MIKVILWDVVTCKDHGSVSRPLNRTVLDYQKGIYYSEMLIVKINVLE